MQWLYLIADLFFMVVHTGLILFNLSGWVWKPLRKANLGVLLLTGLSWTVLGIWHGLGYCPLTDWHFEILERRGFTELPVSYIQFLVHRLSGFDPGRQVSDAATAGGFLISLLISLILNIRDWLGRRIRKQASA